jgi:hypothetical protein
MPAVESIGDEQMGQDCIICTLYSTWREDSCYHTFFFCERCAILYNAHEDQEELMKNQKYIDGVGNGGQDEYMYRQAYCNVVNISNHICRQVQLEVNGPEFPYYYWKQRFFKLCGIL